MGTSLKDFAKLKNNTLGKTPPFEKKPPVKKRKMCGKCGFAIRSAIVTSLFFTGDFCNDCVKEIGK